MIKSELSKNLGKRLPDISEKDISRAVSIILEDISDSLAQGDRVEVRGFGSFSLHFRPPRQAHNPQTGKMIATTAKYSPHFKPGKNLRERVDASRAYTEISADPFED